MKNPRKKRKLIPEKEGLEGPFRSQPSCSFKSIGNGKACFIKKVGFEQLHVSVKVSQQNR